MREFSYLCINQQKYYYFLKRTICIVLVLLSSITSFAAGKIKLSTVVIDAGHGGHDSGCVSGDRKTFEKDLTLDVALALASRIRTAYPDVNVILTRSKDDIVAFDNRAQIANRADADLFISIHINASPKTSPSGYSVHILGKSSNKNRDLFAYNLDVCRRENSVILLEDDYNTKFQGFNPGDPESYIFMVLMQNAYLQQSLRFAQSIQKNLGNGPIKGPRGLWQDPFYVLWKTSLPSVLVELGFISNKDDLAILNDPAGRDKITDCLFNSFREYKSVYDRSINSAADTSSDSPAQVSAGEGVAKVSNTAPAAAAPAPGATASVPAATSASAATPATSSSADQDNSSDAPVYAVQIFAGSNLQSLKSSSRYFGYKPIYVKSGNIYKYFIAASPSLEGAKSELPKIRKKYPQAFLVKITGDSVERQ